MRRCDGKDCSIRSVLMFGATLGLVLLPCVAVDFNPTPAFLGSKLRHRLPSGKEDDHWSLRNEHLSLVGAADSVGGSRA